VNGGLSGPVLKVDAVSHSFGARRVLKDVSLEVSRGEVYGLLGPNGAGKTTLVRIVCGRIKPDSGQVRLSGRDPFADGSARSALGLAPQALALYPLLTVAENLAAFARLAGLSAGSASAAVAETMVLTRIAERAESQVRYLSGGLQRRANIAAALLAKPKLLVLDEPTVGVDLAAREAVVDVLHRLRKDGVGVLLVTHDLEQAEGLADRVGFLDEGIKVLEGVPATLIAEAFGDAMEIEVVLGSAAGPDRVQRLADLGLSPGHSPDAWIGFSADGYGGAASLADRLKALGMEVREIRVRRPSLQQLAARLAQVERAA